MSLDPRMSGMPNWKGKLVLFVLAVVLLAALVLGNDGRNNDDHGPTPGPLGTTSATARR